MSLLPPESQTRRPSCGSQDPGSQLDSKVSNVFSSLLQGVVICLNAFEKGKGFLKVIEFMLSKYQIEDSNTNHEIFDTIFISAAVPSELIENLNKTNVKFIGKPRLSITMSGSKLFLLLFLKPSAAVICHKGKRNMRLCEDDLAVRALGESPQCKCLEASSVFF
ncbi:hypothetical protein MG293_010578 [Ovis ammon polii]|uniref:Uncharacterized protein n=1 Tax=Ovis ammon polii TaxID=230172 RepID=A0AAD4YAB1_OVIAM|nr:hypothetical protein MG293_010578 [Ovis ammon polii]